MTSASPASTKKSAATAEGKTKAVLALLVLLGSWGYLAWFFLGVSPPFEPAPHQALGRVVGEETVKLLGPGGRVVLMDRDPRLFKAPATEAHRKGFHQQLKAAGHTVGLTNLIKIDPLRPATIPAGAFFDTLQRAAEGDVVVCFLAPSLDEGRLSQLGAKRVNVVAVCTGESPQQVDLPHLFELGLVKVAVVSRKGGQSDNRSFESLFELATALDHSSSRNR